MRKEVYLPILGIALGELMMFSGHVYIGLAIHIINLQAIILTLIFSKSTPEIKNVLYSLILLLQMRIINLAMPQFFTNTLLWYPLVYGVMFIPVYSIIKSQEISSKELGIDFGRLYIYLPAALLIGTVMAMLEFQILHPAPLIRNVTFSNLFMLALVMFVFVGTVEELIFRSILQTRVQKLLGLKYGLLVSGIMFGIMHSGYGLINEILFASFFGLILGYIFQKTNSFPFILVVHGTANILLFGILPILLGRF
jgi:membrane protease YdiL (CAAX protease family)